MSSQKRRDNPLNLLGRVAVVTGASRGAGKSESPEYIGRTVAALADDPQVMRKTGKAFHVGELALEYRFRDVDGRRVPPLRIVESFVNMVKKFGDTRNTAQNRGADPARSTHT
jgi:hypothetical protein